MNLVDRQVEVHEGPDADKREYRRRVVRTGAQIVSFAAGPKAAVKVKARDLLP